MSSRAVAHRLTAIARSFYHRGWVYGAGGCCSMALNSGDTSQARFAITPAGVDRGMLRSEQILEVDENGVLRSGLGRIPADIDIQLAVHHGRKAKAVLQTCSVWGLLHAEHAHSGGITLAGYSILNSLSGRQAASSSAAEWLPVMAINDRKLFLDELRTLLSRAPSLHGTLVKGHGLYTWGTDLAEAARHSEILEFLLEVTGRSRFGTPGAIAEGASAPQEEDDEPLYVAPRRGRAVAV